MLTKRSNRRGFGMGQRQSWCSNRTFVTPRRLALWRATSRGHSLPRLRRDPGPALRLPDPGGPPHDFRRDLAAVRHRRARDLAAAGRSMLAGARSSNHPQPSSRPAPGTVGLRSTRPSTPSTAPAASWLLSARELVCPLLATDAQLQGWADPRGCGSQPPPQYSVTTRVTLLCGKAVEVARLSLARERAGHAWTVSGVEEGLRARLSVHNLTGAAAGRTAVDSCRPARTRRTYCFAAGRRTSDQ